MGEPVVFKRSAFGGFDRNEVLHYIDTLNTNAQRTREELESQLTAVTRSRDDFARRVSSFDVVIARLEAQLASEQEKSDRLTRALEQVQDELRNACLREGQRSRELTLEQEKNRQLHDEMDELRRHAEKYDELSAQIGSILIDAQAHAGQIQAQAQAQAEEQIRAAQAEFDKQIHAAQQVSASMLQQLEGLRTQVGELRLKVRQTTECLEAQLNELDGQLNGVCESWGGEAAAVDEVEPTDDTTAEEIPEQAETDENYADDESTDETEPSAIADDAVDFFRFAACP